jgi:hypothetical protein
MKKHVTWLPLILMALFGSAAVSTNAQTGYGVRANVPFDFTIGDKTIPAGKIVARRMSGSDSGPWLIKNVENGQNEVSFANSLRGADTSDQAKLIFRKYGDRYFLAQVWISGSQAWQVVKSSSERAIEREMRLAKNSKPELVTLLAATQ